MAKRIKRVEKGVESLKEEIETHFKKLENDLFEGNIDRGRYHAKEIDKSLLRALEIKLGILGIRDDSLMKFKERLEKIKKDFGYIE